MNGFVAKKDLVKPATDAQLQVLQRVAHLRVAKTECVCGDEHDGACADEEDGGFHGRDTVSPAEEPPPRSHCQAGHLDGDIPMIMRGKETVQPSMVI